MARVRRKRRYLKRVGLSVSLLIALVPMLLLFRDVQYRMAFGQWGSVGTPWVVVPRLYEGRFDVHFGHARVSGEDLGWHVSPNLTPAWQLKPDWGKRRVFWRIEVPLWIPFVLVSLATAFLWWRDHRRISPGHCEQCDYDLTGNTSGVCPECGTPVLEATDLRENAGA